MASTRSAAPTQAGLSCDVICKVRARPGRDREQETARLVAHTGLPLGRCSASPGCACISRATPGIRRESRGGRSEELLVAVSRATATASARHIEFMAPRGSGLRVPLGAASRAALIVEAGRPRTAYEQSASAPRRVRRERSSTSMAAGSCPAASGLNADPRLRTPSPRTATPSASSTAWHPSTRTRQRSTTPSRPTRPCWTEAQTQRPSVLFGASAGACLALSSLLKLRDLGLPQPAGAVLLWPYADFTFSGETIRSNGDLDMLPVRDLAHVWGPAYVGDADPSDPLVSPALADLSGLASAADPRRRRRVAALLRRTHRRERSARRCPRAAERVPREGARLDDASEARRDHAGDRADQQLDSRTHRSRAGAQPTTGLIFGAGRERRTAARGAPCRS